VLDRTDASNSAIAGGRCRPSDASEANSARCGGFGAATEGRDLGPNFVAAAPSPLTAPCRLAAARISAVDADLPAGIEPPAADAGVASCRAAARISAVVGLFVAFDVALFAAFDAGAVTVGAIRGAGWLVPQISRTRCRMTVIDAGETSAGGPSRRTAPSKACIDFGVAAGTRSVRTCFKIAAIVGGCAPSGAASSVVGSVTAVGPGASTEGASGSALGGGLRSAADGAAIAMERFPSAERAAARISAVERRVAIGSRWKVSRRRNWGHVRTRIFASKLQTDN